jgi:hypothetical protein
MKHIVNVTISNPAHDFVSMRTRQSTTNYMVEAKDEAEAILRASRHFRALGHYVHNAVIAESTLNEEVEQIDEDALKARQEWMKAKGVSTGDPKADRARKVKRLMKTFPMKKEEVESIDEVNARHSPEAAQAVLTPTAKIVRAAVGKTARDKAATKKYARRVANISPDYSKKDVMDQLKSMGEEVEQVVEKAPPGAKYERMVKDIKKGYSKDGTLTPKEKAIAYATAWKAKNSGK